MNPLLPFDDLTIFISTRRIPIDFISSFLPTTYLL